MRNLITVLLASALSISTAFSGSEFTTSGRKPSGVDYRKCTHIATSDHTMPDIVGSNGELVYHDSFSMKEESRGEGANKTFE